MARKNRKRKRKIAVIDFETDPFLFGRRPEPFAAGFYTDRNYQEFWGENCVYELLQYLEKLPEPYLIYAHNGGKFDAFYLLELGVLDNPALIINGRIVKCGLLGMHELRDSFAILPIALKKMGKNSKLDIDYALMERDKREENKEEILEYLKQDCVSLYNFVDKFIERFGPKLTIGGTAIAQIAKLHHVPRRNKTHDERFRPYYFGGRVQCFEYGKIEGDFKIYDINSSYPNSMRNFLHPASGNYLNLNPDKLFAKFNHKTGIIENYGTFYFATIIATNRGALPSRTKEGLTFEKSCGIFDCCSHELKKACELGLVEVHGFVKVLIPTNTYCFDEFVDKFIVEKIEGKKEGDEAKTLFAKLLLNSGYGKFATNVDKFKDWYIYDSSDATIIEDFDKWRSDREEKGLIPVLHSDMGTIEIWCCPSGADKGWYDVAIGASITSASRAVLLEAIHNSRRPIYCDTDSLICEEINGVEIHPTNLGAWDCEGETDCVYIAGKKIYAATVNDRGKMKDKIASKGACLKYYDIVRLTEGEEIVWKNDAPNFKMSGETKFVERKIVKRY